MIAAGQDIETKMHEVLDEYEELRKRYAALEETNREMKVSLINVEEETSEWRTSYEGLQAEGRELFQTYERKCTALKQASLQLEEVKTSLADREHKLSAANQELERLRADDREHKSKFQVQAETASKQEIRYLSLKDEHLQALVKIDNLAAQLLEIKDLRSQTVIGQAEMEHEEHCREGMGEQADSSDVLELRTSPSCYQQHAHLPFSTPVRTIASTLTSKLVAKTPGGVLRELEELSPAGIRCVPIRATSLPHLS